MKKRFIDILFIIVGSFFFAIGVNAFVIPNELGEGGVTGVTIITYYLFKWSPGLVNLILNSILLIIGYKFLSRITTIYTIVAVVFNSLFLHLTEGWVIPSNEIVVNAIFGGVIIGAGIGMVIRVGGTTAGSTILAKMTYKYFGWNVSYGLLFFDLIVVFSSYFIIGAEKVMVTIMMLYVATKVMQFIIEGLNPKKAVTIISNEPDKIAKQVNERLHRGVTVIEGSGYYTKAHRDILYIVINSQEIVRLKNIVKEADDKAFIAIHDVRDVFGEGFAAISRAD
jgi:uncharacterized membrane-anchored protein YitT (DUF2179 family)